MEPLVTPAQQLELEPEPTPARQPEPEPEPEPPGMMKPRWRDGQGVHPRLGILRQSDREGRFVVHSPSEPPLANGTCVCYSSAFAIAVMEPWKKRACALCFTIAERRQVCRCASCDQAFYCSELCHKQHASGGSAGTVPHDLVCPALATFSSISSGKKFGKDDVAMLRLMLEIVARDHLLSVGDPRAAAAAEGGFRSGLGFEDLEKHPPEWAESERRDWGKLFALFERALAQCPWYQPAGVDSPPVDWQHMLSRIDSNVFGVFTSTGHLFAQGM